MNDAGRMSILLHTSRHEDEWRRADEWRRLHARPDALRVSNVERAPRRSLATLRGLLVRHA
jgi:hypothetical protein